MQEICTASQTERQEKMEKLSNPQKTIEVIKKYHFNFQKKFGQNFLIDAHVLNKIIASADITKDDCVLEIGPGIGTMTQYLAEAAGKVVAVEIDRNLIPILSETLADYENVTVINEDVLKLDIAKLADEYNQGRPIKVVANLPYYITTPIIMGLFESHVQFYAEPYIVANVPPNCFMPRPNVGSAVIRLTLHENPPTTVKDESLMFRIIRASFNQRRKTLLNGLNNSPEIAATKEQIQTAFEKLGFPANVRGETLTLKEFAALADEFAKF